MLLKSIARVRRGLLGDETTVEKDPVDTIAVTGLVRGSIDAGMIVPLTGRTSHIDLRKEGRDLGETGPPTGLALRTLVDTEVNGRGTTGGADITKYHYYALPKWSNRVRSLIKMSSD